MAVQQLVGDSPPATNSILKDVKKVLGLDESYTPFDPDIVLHINSTIMELEQLGVRPDGYHISGATETWQDYLGVGADLDAVRSFMYISVQMLFDPPTLSSVLTARENILQRYSWRIMAQVEKQNGDLNG